MTRGRSCDYRVYGSDTSLARGAISSINAHHTRLIKLFLSNLVCTKIVLREYFLDENLLDEIKANYGIFGFQTFTSKL